MLVAHSAVFNADGISAATQSIDCHHSLLEACGVVIYHNLTYLKCSARQMVTDRSVSLLKHLRCGIKPLHLLTFESDWRKASHFSRRRVNHSTKKNPRSQGWYAGW